MAVSGSVAMLADTIHSFSDALTAIPLAFAFWLGRRGSTKRYTYGYGRAEDLAGIFIVAMIALSAAIAGWEVRRLFEPRDIDNVGWVMVIMGRGALDDLPPSSAPPGQRRPGRRA